MGLRYQIGFTDDGTIWMRCEAGSPDGTPVQMTLECSRREAISIADELRHAVDESERKVISV